MLKSSKDLHSGLPVPPRADVCHLPVTHRGHGADGKLHDDAYDMGAHTGMSYFHGVPKMG